MKPIMSAHLHLEHAHGTVPDHSFAAPQLVGNLLVGLGSVVEPHPPVGNCVGLDHLGVGISSELASSDARRIFNEGRAKRAKRASQTN